MTVATLWAFLIMQAVFALADPHGFPYLAPLVVLVQIGALVVVCRMVIATPAIRAFGRDKRVHVIHGLEHATIRILEDAGIDVDGGGVTLRGRFEIYLRNGRNYERDAEVRDATLAAIRRVAAGERELAYTASCGTSVMVAQLLLALAIIGAGLTAAILGVPSGITFAASVGAALVARLASRPLGLLAQRLWTVSTALASAKIVAVTKEVSSSGDWVTFSVQLDVVVRDSHAEPIAIV
jgi:hypothetical protein